MKNAKKILAILLALSLVLPIFSLTVVATSFGSVDTSNESLTTLQQHKENVANQKYNLLLKHWSYDGEHIDDVYANFPDFYGGVYIDDSKNLVINLTEINSDTISYFKGLIDLNDVLFEKVDHSYSTLVAEKDAVAVKMEEVNRKYGNSVVATGVSVSLNSVNLYIDTDTVEKCGANLSTVCKNLTTFSNVNVIEVSGEDQLCSSSYLRPGDYIYFTGGARSVGFWAYDSNNNLGIITSPHNTVSGGDTASIYGDEFGVASIPYFSGNIDAVFVRRTNSDFAPSRYVAGHNTYHASGTPITMAENSNIYSRGKDSLHRTGFVQDTNYTTSYGLHNCVLTSAFAQSGDSGGIVLGGGDSNTRYIAGIITGRQNSINYMIYCKASYFLTILDCTIY